MDPLTIIAVAEAAAKALLELYNAYQQGKVVLSEQNAQAVHAALLQLETTTAQLRPRVDATLAAAAKRSSRNG